MAEKTDREPASRRSAAGRWKPVAHPRADPGDAAGVDLNAVLGRAVLDVVRQVCRRHGNFWQGKPRKLVSSCLADTNRATEDNEDGADATVTKKKRRSPSYRRRSERRLVKFMQGQAGLRGVW